MIYFGTRIHLAWSIEVQVAKRSEENNTHSQPTPRLYRCANGVNILVNISAKCLPCLNIARTFWMHGCLMSFCSVKLKAKDALVLVARVGYSV